MPVNKSQVRISYTTRLNPLINFDAGNIKMKGNRGECTGLVILIGHGSCSEMTNLSSNHYIAYFELLGFQSAINLFICFSHIFENTN